MSGAWMMMKPGECRAASQRDVGAERCWNLDNVHGPQQGRTGDEAVQDHERKQGLSVDVLRFPGEGVDVGVEG